MEIQSPLVVSNLTISGTIDLQGQASSSLVNNLTSSLNTLYTVSGSVGGVDEYTVVLLTQLF